MCAETLSPVRLFCDPVDCWAPVSMGILQARVLGWVATPSSRGSSPPRDRTLVSALQAGSLPSEPPRASFNGDENGHDWLVLSMTHFLGLGRGLSTLSQGYREPRIPRAVYPGGGHPDEMEKPAGSALRTHRALGVSGTGYAVGPLGGSGWEQAPCGDWTVATQPGSQQPGQSAAGPVIRGEVGSERRAGRGWWARAVSAPPEVGRPAQADVPSGQVGS